MRSKTFRPTFLLIWVKKSAYVVLIA